MTPHEKKAGELFRSGCSCAQSVFTAFSDVTGFDEKTSLRMSAPFGAGFGRMREMCGAVSGMCLATGCLYGYDDINNKDIKTAHYEMISSMIIKFKKEMGSYICHELLGLDNYVYSPVAENRTKDYYDNRPCEKCVMTAARILDELIAEKGLT